MYVLAIAASVLSYVVTYYLIHGVSRIILQMVFGTTLPAIGVALDATIATLVAVKVYNVVKAKQKK